jgi:hypothetical protein
MCHSKWFGTIVLLIKHSARKILRGVNEGVAPFLTSILDRGEWSPLCPRHFSLGERSHSTCLIEGKRLDGPQSQSGQYGKEKNLAHSRN